MNLPFRIFFVVLCCVIGLVLPFAFLIAAWVAYTIWDDLTSTGSKNTEGYVDHTKLTSSDPEWKQAFNEQTESPAEVAFLEAMVDAFDLKPHKGKLRGKDITLQFQVNVWPYRLDFLVDKRLVVEIDGAAWHSSDEAVENDRQRDLVLERKGYKVLRIPAKVPLYDPADAVARVRTARRGLAEEKARPRNSNSPTKDGFSGKSFLTLLDAVGDLSQYEESRRVAEEDAKLRAQEEDEARVRLVHDIRRLKLARRAKVKDLFERIDDPGIEEEIQSIKQKYHDAGIEERRLIKENKLEDRKVEPFGSATNFVRVMRPGPPPPPIADDKDWLRQARKDDLESEMHDYRWNYIWGSPSAS